MSGVILYYIYVGLCILFITTTVKRLEYTLSLMADGIMKNN